MDLRVALAIALTACALAVMIRAMKLRHRGRLFTLTVLLVMAAAVIGTLGRGAGGSVPMGYVIAIGDEVPEEALFQVLESLPGDAPVTFIALRATKVSTEPEAVSPDAKWTTLREILARAEEVGVVAACLKNAPRISTQDPLWGGRLAAEAEAATRSLPLMWFLRAPALIVLSDDGRVWRDADPGGVQVGTVVTGLARADGMPLYIKRLDGSRSSGSLRLVPNQDSLPSVRSMADLSGATVSVILDNGPASIADAKVTFSATLDVASFEDDKFATSSFVLVPPAMTVGDDPKVEGRFEVRSGPNGDLMVWTLGLWNFRHTGKGPIVPISAGLHRLCVSVTAELRSGEHLSYQAECYLVVRPRDLAFISCVEDDSTQFGRLTDDGWKITFRQQLKRSSPSQLLKFFFDNKEKGQISRTRRFGAEFFQLPPANAPPKDFAAIRTALASVRGLVVLEPSAEQLERLDDEFDLEQRIAQGLNVMIVGPPVTATPPSWLPTTARPSRAPDREDQPARVHRDGRLYILFDTSRYMRIKLGTEQTTPLKLQVDCANSLVKSLGLQEGDDVFSIAGERVQGPDKPLTRKVPRDADLRIDLIDEKPDGLTLAPAPSFSIPNRAESIVDRSKKDFAAGDHYGYSLDLGPGHVPIRLASLFRLPSSEVTTSSLWLEPGDAYPETHIVVFQTGFDHDIHDIPVIWTFDGEKMRSTELEKFPTIGDLEAMGVRLHIVRIARATPEYKAHVISRSLHEPSFEPALNVHPLGLPKQPSPAARVWALDSGPIDAKQEGRLLAEQILAQATAKFAFATGGRDIDQRVAFDYNGNPASVPGPEHHILLSDLGHPFSRPSGFLVTEDSGVIIPMLTSSNAGEGQVVTTAYSPFAPDVWLRDVWRSAPDIYTRGIRSPKLARMHGWGVQRIIDFSELNGAVVPRSGENLVLLGASVSEDSGTFFLQAVSSGGGSTWNLPTLRFKDRPERAMEIYRQDKATGLLVFRYIAEAAIDGAVQLTHGKTASTNIALQLEPPTSLGGFADELLAQAAALSGGGEIADNEQIPSRSSRATTWVSLLVLTAIMACVMSPLVLPWSGLKQLLDRRRLKLQRKTPLPIDDLLTEWGVILGKPTTAQIAGIPGTSRLFESGDRLGAAKASSLLGFTVIGRRLGLPKRPPVVRVKHEVYAMDALVLLDHTHAFDTPKYSPNPTKAEMALFCARIAAGVVWMRDGSVTLASASGDPRLGVGPLMGTTSSDDLESCVQKMIEHPMKRTGLPVLPDGLADGMLVFLITDVPSCSPEDFGSLAQRAVSLGSELRVIQVFDPYETSLAGIGRIAGRAMFVDRLEANRGTVHSAYEQEADEVRQRLEPFGFRSVLLNSGATPSELMVAMSEAGILQ